jgi:hypothetical protein
MTDADLDRLAGILYCAYNDEGAAGWDECKREYPSLAECWRRTASAAVDAVVIVSIKEPT